MQRMTIRYGDKIYFDNARFSKNDALRRLAEYEETGLSPIEILALRDKHEQLVMANAAKKIVEEPKKKGWWR